MQPGERSFELIDHVKFGGRYVQKTPSGAAKKAFSQLNRELREHGKPEQEQMEITLRETTRGSKSNTYRYLVSRQQRQSPEVVQSNSGGNVEFNYEVKAVSLN